VRLEEIFLTACGRGLIARAVEARLRDVSPAELSRDANPCRADGRAFTAAQKSRGQGESFFEPQEMGIVARCGSRLTKLRLINPSKAQPAPTFSTPSRDLWKLANHVIDLAFANKTLREANSEADDREMQEAGAKLLPELSTGRYDLGLRLACNPQYGGCQSRTFQRLIDDYQGARNVSQLAAMTTPHLLDRDRYKFTKYVEPLYPALAKSAHIEGRGELRLVVDSRTGDVTNVTVASGHPMLISNATETAKQWRFAPNAANLEPIKVVLDYAIRCPNPPLIPTATQ
jgi:TonB family protein